MEAYNADTDDYRITPIAKLLTLKDKAIVVTGGARGLGLAIAVGCAELGGKVAILDILDEPTDELGHLKDNGIELHYYHADVCSIESLQQAFQKAEESLGPVSGLVNAAGIGPGGPFEDCDPTTMDKILAVNVKGSMFASQLAIRQMRASQQAGAIVNIASIGGHAAIPGQQNAVYCASKGAIVAFTKSLAVELAESGIRVNSVSPGFFLTRVTPGHVDGNISLIKRFESLVPVRRFADRSELKGIVAFLLTPASSYITGEDIAVDGGVLAS